MGERAVEVEEHWELGNRFRIRSMGSMVCVGRDEGMGSSSGGAASGPQDGDRNAEVKTRKKKEEKKKEIEKISWRRRDNSGTRETESW